VRRKLQKADICRSIAAALLIDDSVDNALACVRDQPAIPVLLFGSYPWGQRASTVVSDLDKMSFAARCVYEQSSNWWEEDVIILPSGIMRVSSWREAVQRIQAYAPVGS